MIFVFHSNNCSANKKILLTLIEQSIEHEKQRTPSLNELIHIDLNSERLVIMIELLKTNVNFSRRDRYLHHSLNYRKTERKKKTHYGKIVNI